MSLKLVENVDNVSLSTHTFNNAISCDVNRPLSSSVLDPTICSNDSCCGEEQHFLTPRTHHRVHHVTNYETRFFSNITTYHGLVRLYHSKWWSGRLLWAFVVIFSLVFFIFHTSMLLYAYSEKATVTQVNLLVPEKGLEFPDVTICNFNPLSWKSIERNDEYPEMPDNVLSYILLAYMRVETIGNQYSDEGLTALKNSYNAWTCRYRRRNCKKFDIYGFFSNNTITCNETVKWCTFGGVRVDDCCQFAEPVMTDAGPCIRFPRFGNHTHQTISGPFFGLHMLLDTQTTQRRTPAINNTAIEQCRCAGSLCDCNGTYPNYPPDFELETLNDMLAGSDQFANEGLKFLVSSKEHDPFLTTRASSVPPGKKAHAALAVRHFKLLSKEQYGYGVCRNNWPSSEPPMEAVNYTNSYCEANCVAYRFKDNPSCGCMPLSYFFKKAPNATERGDICSPEEVNRCINNKNAINISSCSCLMECDRMQYDITLSYSDLSNRFSSKKLMLNSKETSNYVRLNIFINEMFYETNTQLPAGTRSNLLSNVGGSMGLFMGMSIITLMEIFMYICKCVWGFLSSARGKDLKGREEQITADLEEEMIYHHEHDDIDHRPYSRTHSEPIEVPCHHDSLRSYDQLPFASTNDLRATMSPSGSISSMPSRRRPAVSFIGDKHHHPHYHLFAQHLRTPSSPRRHHQQPGTFAAVAATNAI